MFVGVNFILGGVIMRNLILAIIVCVLSGGPLFDNLTAHAQSDSESGIITKEQIKEALEADTRTRGMGGVTSITFGESLIPFDYDKSNVRSDAIPQLNELGGALSDIIVHKDIAVVKVYKVSKANKPVIEVRGYTDSRGSYEYNMRLSKKRAQAVVNYLTQNYNIPRYKLVAKGYGENNLLCTDSSEACHALNRRVEVATIPGAQFSSATRGIDETSSKGLGQWMDTIDIAALYKKQGSNRVHVIKGVNTILVSNSDKIFFYFKPHLDSYVEVRQIDATGNVQTLFPKSFVRKGKDYWLPAFGDAYTLDSNRGQEKIVVYTSLNDPGSMTNDQFTTAITRSLDNPTRSIRPVAAEAEVEVESDTLSENLGDIRPYIVTYQGRPEDSEWSKEIIFQHR